MELARSWCRPKSLRSIFLSVIDLWVKIWHRNKTACSDSIPVQSSRSKSTTCPRKGYLLRFESNSTATSDRGAQKLGNDVRRDSESIATKVCIQISRKWNAMLKAMKWPNIHLLYYWPIIDNSISKLCPEFQVISSHVFEVDELLDEHWAKILRSEYISTPNYVECDKLYRSKVCVHEFSYFGIGLGIQLEQSESCRTGYRWLPVRTLPMEPLWCDMGRCSRTVVVIKLRRTSALLRKKIGCRWRNTTSHIPFFSEIFIPTNGLVVKVNRCELGDLGSIPVGWWNLFRLSHFAWHWTRQCTDTCSFYIAALSSFVFLDFVSGDLALTDL